MNYIMQMEKKNIPAQVMVVHKILRPTDEVSG